MATAWAGRAGPTAPRQDHRAAPRAGARSWRYAEEGQRDLRLDLLRGFAVFAMVVDHIGGASWLYALTGGNRFFVSAAEGFVFLSGVTVGLVYGARARRDGLRAAAGKLLQRAWLLYVLAIWLAIGFALTATILNDPHGYPFAQAPARFIFEVVTLQRTFYLVDVLLLYLFAMIATIGALALLRRGWWWELLLASGALWLLFQLRPDLARFPWPIADNPVFNFAPWQLLFCVGLIIGYHRRWLAERVAARLPESPLRDGYVLPLGAAVGLLIWLSHTNAAIFDRFAPNGDMAAVLDAWFLKSHLPLPRLLACALVFAFAWALVTRCWRPVRALTGRFLLVLGQGALYAYAAHLFLAALVQFAVVAFLGIDASGGYPSLPPGVNAAIQVVALAFLWACTSVQFLQGVVAPLGNPPFTIARLRLGRFLLPRPSEPLIALGLVALVTMVGVLPRSPEVRATAQGAARVTGTTTALAAIQAAKSTAPAPRPVGGLAIGSGAGAAPVSTVTAPRSVAGPAAGSTNGDNGFAGSVQGAPVAPGAAGGGQQGEPQAAPPATPTAPAGYLLDRSFYSVSLGREMPYGIYLPPGYDGAAARYPVLYMLHGIGGHYSEWVAYGLADTAERLIQAKRIGPLIIVFAQGNESYFVNHAGADGERWGDYTAIDLTAHIDTTYRTIPTRGGRAIGGLSMGGFGALSLAFSHPDIYGVVGAHSPSLRTQGEAPGYLGNPAAYALIDPTALAREIPTAVAPRIWIDLGTEDEWAERTSALKDLLRARGLRPDYSESDGGHEPGYWQGNTSRYLRFYAAALTPAR